MSFYVTTAHLMCHEARLAHIVSKEYAGTLREVEPHIAVSAYGKPQCSSTLEIHTAMCMRKAHPHTLDHAHQAQREWCRKQMGCCVPRFS